MCELVVSSGSFAPTGMCMGANVSLTPTPGSKYPGFQIGANVPLSHGHRHFSHLFMIFPLKQLNFSDVRPAVGDMAIAEASVDHWLGMTQGLTGFCRRRRWDATRRGLVFAKQLNESLHTCVL